MKKIFTVLQIDDIFYNIHYENIFFPQRTNFFIKTFYAYGFSYIFYVKDLTHGENPLYKPFISHSIVILLWQLSQYGKRTTTTLPSS